ncbi:MAG: hypothetical protein ORN83_12655 [Chthoniobacteraceae bacterium]|nr:hypothetical protein [Chthoniobacteraceae bacterium]
MRSDSDSVVSREGCFNGIIASLTPAVKRLGNYPETLCCDGGLQYEQTGVPFEGRALTNGVG